MEAGINHRAQRIIQSIQRHPNRYLYGTLGLYFFISATLNTSITWLEYGRAGRESLLLWEAPLWEYSSALSFLIWCPLLFAGFRRYPVRLSGLFRQLLGHLIASVVFCLAHVGLMVALREAGYALAGEDYRFGPWLRELWYEYQKDGWSYLSLLAGYQLAVFVISRIQGEAHWLDVDESQPQAPESADLQQVLVKKLDKEFLVRFAEVQWLEANGNYVNLHSHGRVFPLRSTLTQLESQLAGLGFTRVHRRFLVQTAAVDHLSVHASGDGELTLKDGTVLNLSRRYREALRQSLSLG